MAFIVMDMDGTLLNANKEISPSNLKSILRAQEKGYEIVIATGRFSNDAWRILKPYGFRHWLISSNGAMVHSPEGIPLETTPMDPRDVAYVMEWLNHNGYYFEITSNLGIHAWLNHHESLLAELGPLKAAEPQTDIQRLKDVITLWSVQKGYQPIQSFEHLLDKAEEWHNILIISFTPALLEAGMEHFRQWGRLTVSKSWQFNFELMAPNASKGNALRNLTQRLGLSLDQSMAMGDNHNDLSMLTAVGYGVAMGNAEDGVKNQCPYITVRNTEDGVSQAIEALLSGNLSGLLK